MCYPTRCGRVSAAHCVNLRLCSAQQNKRSEAIYISRNAPLFTLRRTEIFRHLSRCIYHGSSVRSQRDGKPCAAKRRPSADDPGGGGEERARLISLSQCTRAAGLIYRRIFEVDVYINIYIYIYIRRDINSPSGRDRRTRAQREVEQINFSRRSLFSPAWSKLRGSGAF